MNIKRSGFYPAAQCSTTDAAATPPSTTKPQPRSTPLPTNLRPQPRPDQQNTCPRNLTQPTGTQWTQAISLKLGIFAWARANDVELILDHPYDFRVDLLADGIATLDWLDAGNDEVVLRVHQAFRDGLVALGPVLQPEDDAERHAIQIRLMEQAAERSRGD